MRLLRTTALAALALGMGLGVSLAGSARADDQVQVFDNDVPSVAQLRSILIPPVPADSASRRILIPGHDQAAPNTNVQPTSAGTATSPSAQAAAPTPSHIAPESPIAVGFRINFGLNSDVVPAHYHPQLDRMVELLRDEPSLALTVEGHTDATGSDDYNLDLSRRRAIAIKSYMVTKGVPADRLTAIGKGKTEPLMRDPYDSRNRRVQFSRVNPAERT